MNEPTIPGADAPQAQDDPRGTPFFAPAGWQSHYFVVRDGITEESALVDTVVNFRLKPRRV